MLRACDVEYSRKSEDPRVRAAVPDKVEYPQTSYSKFYILNWTLWDIKTLIVTFGKEKCLENEVCYATLNSTTQCSVMSYNKQDRTFQTPSKPRCSRHETISVVQSVQSQQASRTQEVPQIQSILGPMPDLQIHQHQHKSNIFIFSVKYFITKAKLFKDPSTLCPLIWELLQSLKTLHTLETSKRGTEDVREETKQELEPTNIKTFLYLILLWQTIDKNQSNINTTLTFWPSEIERMVEMQP